MNQYINYFAYNHDFNFDCCDIDSDGCEIKLFKSINLEHWGRLKMSIFIAIYNRMKIPKNDEPAEILSSNTFEVNAL